MDIRDQQDKSKDNYSKILRKFVHPIINEEDDISLVETKYAFGIHVWNATAVRLKDEQMFKDARAQIAYKTSEIPEGERLFDEMVKLKEEDYAEYKNAIIDFEVLGNSGKDYDLTVASAPLKK